MLPIGTGDPDYTSTYKMVLQSDNSLENYSWLTFAYNAVTNKLDVKVVSTVPGDAGVYNVRIVGTLDDPDS